MNGLLTWCRARCSSPRQDNGSPGSSSGGAVVTRVGGGVGLSSGPTGDFQHKATQRQQCGLCEERSSPQARGFPPSLPSGILAERSAWLFGSNENTRRPDTDTHSVVDSGRSGCTRLRHKLVGLTSGGGRCHLSGWFEGCELSTRTLGV